MDWKISFGKVAEKQFAKLDRQVQEAIAAFFYDKVAAEPDPRRIGKALTGEFKGYWRYRIGDYRAICEIRDHELIVFVLELGHRKEIYR